jgi:tRNA(fMet)-specific endonuclease VapC
MKTTNLATSTIFVARHVADKWHSCSTPTSSQHLWTSPSGTVARRMRGHPREDLWTSVIVAAELRFGAERRNSRRLMDRIVAALEEVTILPFASPADEIYAHMRTKLEVAGTLVGAHDMLIAAHALALGATLVTDNVREFARVEGLAVENPGAWNSPGYRSRDRNGVPPAADRAGCGSPADAHGPRPTAITR